MLVSNLTLPWTHLCRIHSTLKFIRPCTISGWSTDGVDGLGAPVKYYHFQIADAMNRFGSKKQKNNGKSTVKCHLIPAVYFLKETTPNNWPRYLAMRITAE